MKKKTVPFIILAIFHAILFSYTFNKNRQNTLAILFTSIGIAYVFEYFVLNIFKMYTYYPRVYKNRWIDSVFGALLSQSLFVPIVGTSLVIFNLGWRWRIGVSLFYGLVERLFIRWQIFRNNGWKTGLTVTSMPFYFYIVDKWWREIENGNETKKNVLLFFFYWINYTNALYFSLALLHKYFFRIGFLKDRYWEHFILVPIYTLITAVIATMSTLVNEKIKPFGLLILHLFDQLLFKLKIIQPSRKEYLYMLIPVHIFNLWLGKLYFRLLKKIHNQATTD
ncbi:hypothetical protein ACFYKX_04795 [Cytobacillus sp. FJAT-54145]|uniref:Prolipoprotein diacylglyceryl transferase n=1 Tax=Cytobacillus spartinae TaxID=3299023 RepID=A0ABW6KAX1_9BACI